MYWERGSPPLPILPEELVERRRQLSEKLHRSNEKRIEGLIEHLDLKEQLIAQMQKGLEDYAETITQQATDIEGYENALRLGHQRIFDPNDPNSPRCNG